jgi:hypothetical protein
MGDAYTPNWSRLPNDPDYAAAASYQAGLHTESARKLYAKNERRLERARQRAERAEAKLKEAQANPKISERALADLWLSIERRRDELAAIEREMQRTPAGSVHRGRGSYRGVA